MNRPEDSQSCRLANTVVVAGVLTTVALTGWIHERANADHPESWRSGSRIPHLSADAPLQNHRPWADSRTEHAVMTRKRTPSSSPTDLQETGIRLLLKDLHRVQSEWHAASAIDENQNQLGEYGLLGELCGASTERCTARAYVTCLTAELPAVFDSTSVAHGYLLQVFLPDAEDNAIVEATKGGVGGTRPDPERSERSWCCYAWPVHRPSTGKSVYFIDQSGILLRSDNEQHRYSGRFRRPLPTAAFACRSSGRLGAAIANHGIGVDGQHWTVIE